MTKTHKSKSFTDISEQKKYILIILYKTKRQQKAGENILSYSIVLTSRI